MVIINFKNRVSNKNQNFEFRANFLSELIGKGHEPSRKFFSSSQLGSDSSLLLTYLLAYSCTCCLSATALPGGPGGLDGPGGPDGPGGLGGQLTKLSFADHSLLCQVIGLLGSNPFSMSKYKCN